jgi:hypothetical protein
MHFTTTGTSSPNTGSGVAHITRKRNRVKVYKGTDIYLKDGENFEIELFNPTKSKLLAKIEINGQYISESGLIIRPGERIYLERFIDSNNKFLFETYEIEDSKESKKATVDNGKVRIEFYPEFYLNNYYKYYDLIKGSTGTTGLGNVNTFYYDDTSSSNTINLNSSTDYFSTNISANFNFQEISNSMETGRIEKGEKSDQEFKKSEDEFYFVPCNIVSYKILPESKKVIESKDIRNYCVSCGTRIRKSSWKFCPSCGGSID